MSEIINESCQAPDIPFGDYAKDRYARRLPEPEQRLNPCHRTLKRPAVTTCEIVDIWRAVQGDEYIIESRLNQRLRTPGKHQGIGCHRRIQAQPVRIFQ